MITPKQLSWIITAFFAAIVAVVFYQISTSMTEQGIASGGPYDNGAAYPRAVAIAICVLAAMQLAIDHIWAKSGPRRDAPATLADLKRPALLLVVFAIYLNVLTLLGYHLTTTPMIIAIMWICGARQIGRLLLAALVMSFVFAYLFEKILNVVLPGGVLGLNIPW